jgi:putative spermidine/putrescine transport system ATP-binding protein
MNAGEILQIAAPSDIYERPASLFVAQFVGEMNFVKGKIGAKNLVDTPVGPIAATTPAGSAVGAPVTLAIRPEHVKVTALDNGGSGTTGKIASRNYLGDAALVEVEVNGVTLLAKLAGDTALSVGQTAAVELPAQRWQVFQE